MTTLTAGQRSRRLIGLVCALLLCATALVLASTSAAHADPYPPSNACTISLSTGTVEAGQSVTLTGSGFPANSSVALTAESTPVGIGAVQTDGNGSFSLSITIPTSLPAGSHQIVANVASQTCAFPFTVPTPSPSPSPSPSTSHSPSPSPSPTCATDANPGLGIGGAEPTCGIAGTSAHRTPSHSPNGLGIEAEPPTSAGLASTGFQTAAATLIALVLLSGGVMLTVLGRRRRHG